MRTKATSYIEQEPDRWEHTGRVVLDMNFIKLDKWLDIMKMLMACGDELMLFILNVLYCRHMVVYTENRVWTTISNASSTNMSLSELHDKCDVHLAFLGNYTFGKLKRKPMLPAPVFRPPPSLVITRKRGRPQRQVPLDLRISCTDKVGPLKKLSGRIKESIRIIELFEKHSQTTEIKESIEPVFETPPATPELTSPDNLKHLCEQYFEQNYPKMCIDSVYLRSIVNVLQSPETLKTLARKKLESAFPTLDNTVIDAMVACEVINSPDRLKQLCLK